MRSDGSGYRHGRGVSGDRPRRRTGPVPVGCDDRSARRRSFLHQSFGRKFYLERPWHCRPQRWLQRLIGRPDRWRLHGVRRVYAQRVCRGRQPDRQSDHRARIGAPAGRYSRLYFRRQPSALCQPAEWDLVGPGYRCQFRHHRPSSGRRRGTHLFLPIGSQPTGLFPNGLGRRRGDRPVEPGGSRRTHFHLRRSGYLHAGTCESRQRNMVGPGHYRFCSRHHQSEPAYAGRTIRLFLLYRKRSGGVMLGLR